MVEEPNSNTNESNLMLTNPDFLDMHDT